MKKLLREPLLHFLLLGAAIFVVHGWVSKTESGEPGEIVVTQGQVENIATVFAKAWQRPPTAEELTGLIRDRVREEVYCREAVTLGLDKDDTVIRRRLRQKMEFVSDDIAAQTEPTDADLENYLKANADKFRVEQKFTFQQVFLDPHKHGDRLPNAIARQLSLLNQSGEAPGDPCLLDPSFDDISKGAVARQFGEKFAGKLAELIPGQWQGPVESGYGVHLVKVTVHTGAAMPALAEVRDNVRREWDNVRRQEANERFYQVLQSRFKITIEQPEPKHLAQANR